MKNGTEIIDENGAIKGDIQATPGSISAAELASTLDLSSKTVTLATGEISAGELAATLDLSGKSVTLAAKEIGVGEIALTSGSIPRGAASGAAEELVKGSANQILAMDGAGGFPNYYTVGGDLTQATGTFTLSNSLIVTKTFTIASGGVKALAASPVTIASSPGVGKANVFLNATIKLAPNALDAFAENGGGSNLAFKLGNGSGLQVSEDIEMTGFITQTTNYLTSTNAKKDLIAAQTTYEDKALVLHNIGAGEITGDAAGTGELQVSVSYRVINL